ncbi:MAG: hypothetical protein A2X47_04020 [Lentisphaerae bacterium GWF2_38_69]|nr:MAG: hypothetical protein A2X47_04020 [Lentisphaerae bacterium GWF2_38_69]
MDRKIYGTIFDIQGHSVHDGPGSRTLIFLKGCPMKCRWCSNPEGQNLFPEPLYLKQKCIYDSLCVRGCPERAIKIDNDILLVDRKKCANCKEYLCAKVCCSGALRIAGRRVSIDEVFTIIQRDRAFWGNDGGVTLTGGEPLMQGEFTLNLLRKCYDSYIHTAIETCGYVSNKTVKSVLPYLDWIFFDLKHINEKKHIEATGVSNKLILDNVKLVASEFKGRLIFRIVIIPDYNDSDEETKAFADFINSLPLKIKEVNILPLHHMGKEKYAMSGRDYYFSDIIYENEERLFEIKRIFNKNNIECNIGADTPF